MAAGTHIRTYFQGQWHDGNPAVMRAADHGIWLGTLVFDGARSHQGKVPDLDLHCQRVNASARVMGMQPSLSAEKIQEIAMDGIAAYSSETSLYVRPMYWSTENGKSVIIADPESTEFCLCLEEIPMPAADVAATMTLSSFVRPLLSMATANAKAACLYPNNARMIREAHDKGFDNALVLDALGNVAESATANVFMVKGGVAKTPIPNGTFLNGITRQRIMRLLSEDGVEVVETVLSYEDFLAADEVFMTGNITKVTPISKIDNVNFGHGEIAKRARSLYWDWAGFTA